MIIDRSIARIAANRIADFLTRKPSLNIAACACAFTAVYGAGIIIHAQEPQTPAATQPAQHTSDTDHAARSRSKIVATSKGGITITFSECRKNDKEHVSCQFADPSGKLHWVYLAGVDLPAGE